MKIENRKFAGFLVLTTGVVVAVAAYVALRPAPAADGDAASSLVTDDEALRRALDEPFVLFRNADLGPQHGVLALTPLAGGARYATPLRCERVHFAAGRGVCLVARRGVTTSYQAVAFDRTFTPLHTIALEGIPSRVRMSPDGRRAGITVFVSGDSYAVAGSFSTRTTIVDVDSGTALGQLEDYKVVREGRPFKEVDFNYWGVTFADARRFYATLGTGGRTYLVEMNADARTGVVIQDDVECPALSPDGTRVAFKARTREDGRLVFRLTVLNLATRERTTLAETRSVDDQVEWLDDERILYGLPGDARAGTTDVWAVPADGTGSPTRMIEHAWSPAVVRLSPQ